MADKWQTTFGSWLRGYGVSRLVGDLRGEGVRLTERAVYQWVEGGTTPRPKHAIAMSRLSLGTVPLEAIYRHPLEVGDAAGNGNRACTVAATPHEGDRRE